MENTGQHVSENHLRESLITLVVESWRVTRVFERMLLKLDAGEQQRFANQIRWFFKKVEESMAQAGLRIVNIEGQPYDLGMAVTAVNIDEFNVDDTLLVEQMLEPVVMGQEGLVRQGTVRLRRIEQ